MAVLGTVFFDAVVGRAFHVAFSRCLWIQVVASVALLVLTPLLPRKAREPADESVALESI